LSERSALTVRGVAVVGFPEEDFHDRESSLDGVFEDQAGDILGRRVPLHHKNTLASITQNGQQWIVAAEQQIVIQIFVDPVLDIPLDIAKIDEDSAVIERISPQSNHGATVMTV